MVRQFIFFTLLFFSFSISAQAEVWKVDPYRNWDPFWEQRYARFIERDASPTFFKDLGGAWAALPLDCADAAYAFRIYFSWKNRLPWNARNDWAYFSQAMNKYDDRGSEEKRVIALIDDLLSKLSTRTISKYDAYPVKLDDLRPGDMFLYKIGEGDNVTRHAFILKKIREDGTIDVLYSTQEKAENGEPLSQADRKNLQHKPVEFGWGFKRFKSNIHVGTDQKNVPDASMQQYSLAKKVEEYEFFAEIEKLNRIHEEHAWRRIRRLLQGLCRDLNDRAEVVMKAWQNVQNEGGKCFNFRKFDAYSTPSRDAGILKSYELLERSMQEIRERGEVYNLKPKQEEVVNAIFTEGKRTVEQRELLNWLCHVRIEYGDQTQLANLGNFYNRLKAGKVSSHPNDNPMRRWGFEIEEKTSCNPYYIKNLQ